jgi:hypothetical protein
MRAPNPVFSFFGHGEAILVVRSWLIVNYMGNKRPLFSVPMSMLMAVASLIGKKEEIRKLSVPIQVDGEETTNILNWSPVQSPEDGVKDAVECHLARKSLTNYQ